MKWLFLLTLFATSAFAQNYYCSDWARQNGYSCVFGGRNASVWERQCENPCGLRNQGPQCDVVKICFDKNPNEINSYCSEWVRESGVSCHNPMTGRWEQKWVRVCDIGLATSWCSDQNPNNN